MDYVDGPCYPIHSRAAEAVPRLVEDGARQRKLANGDGRHKLGPRWLRMACGHTHELDAGALSERAGRLDRGDRGSSRHLMPALLERVRDPDHGGIVSLDPVA
jgi:hypothetical protein